MELIFKSNFNIQNYVMNGNGSHDYNNYFRNLHKLLVSKFMRICTFNFSFGRFTFSDEAGQITQITLNK